MGFVLGRWGRRLLRRLLLDLVVLGFECLEEECEETYHLELRHRVLFREELHSL